MSAILGSMGGQIPIQMAQQMLQQPQAQQPAAPPTNLGMIQGQLDAAQRQQALAAALMTQGYTPNSGALGSIAQIFGAYAGKKLDRQAGEKVSDALGRDFEARTQLANEKAAREAAEELAKEQRAAAAALNLKAAPGWEAAPTSAREYGLAKDDPAYAAFLEQDRRSRGTNVTVNSGPTGPQATKFQEALGGKQAEQFVTWQQDQVAAQDVKAKVQALREISKLQKTGKVQEAQALIGQYFGTQAGANLQAFNATTGPMVLDLAAKLKPLSNSDIDFVKTMVPRFGNDPRANDQILTMLDAAADRQSALYDDAATYAETHRSLDGFRPSYKSRQPNTAPDGPAKARPRATNDQGVTVEWNGSAWVKVK